MLMMKTMLVLYEFFRIFLFLAQLSVAAFEGDDLCAGILCVQESVFQCGAFFLKLGDLAALVVFVEQKDARFFQALKRFARIHFFIAGEEDVLRFFSECRAADLRAFGLSNVDGTFKNGGGNTEEKLTGRFRFGKNEVGFGIVNGAFFSEKILSVGVCDADRLAFDAVAAAVIRKRERSCGKGGVPADIMLFVLLGQSVKHKLDEGADRGFAGFVGALYDVDALGKVDRFSRKLAKAFDI